MERDKLISLMVKWRIWWPLSQNHRVVANCDVTSASTDVTRSFDVLLAILMGKQTVIIVCRCFGIC